jgi:toxin ParE1/3/4
VKRAVIHPKARQELADSIDYYERQRSGLGKEFKELIQEVVRTIQERPVRYPLQRDGTRKVIVKRFPFAIHYLDLPGVVSIVAFAHMSRDPGYWHQRL